MTSLMWTATTRAQHGREGLSGENKGREAMTLPGFAAETSLYRTSVRYWLIGATVQAAGVRQQLGHIFGGCGPCFLDIAGGIGTCVRYCATCLVQPPGLCLVFAESCDPSACPLDCTVLKNNCRAYNGTVQDCSTATGTNCTGCDCCPPCCFKCNN